MTYTHRVIETIEMVSGNLAGMTLVQSFPIVASDPYRPEQHIGKERDAVGTRARYRVIEARIVPIPDNPDDGDEA